MKAHAALIGTPLAILALIVGLHWPGAGLAMDSGGSKKKECPKGQTWSERDGKCVAARSEDIIDDELTQQGRQLARDGQYERALELLHAVKRGGDPIALTYLGYSYRKLGQVDRGIAYYHQALAIDPDNVDTREYLGEGYVAAGRTDLARVQLAEIERRCGTACEEYQELRDAIAAATQ